MKTLIVGIGSTIRGDDGVGVSAAKQCEAHLCSAGNVDVVEIGTGGLSLLDVIQGYDCLILLDAIITGSAPGTVHILGIEELIETVHLGPGHEADLITTLELGRKLAVGTLPAEIHIVAIEVSDITTFSSKLTPAVQSAIPAAVSAVEGLLRR